MSGQEEIISSKVAWLRHLDDGSSWEAAADLQRANGADAAEACGGRSRVGLQTPEGLAPLSGGAAKRLNSNIADDDDAACMALMLYAKAR